MSEIAEILRALPPAGRGPAVLATLVSVAGSSYRRPGARLLVYGDARVGSISGGCLEEDILARTHTVAASGKAELITYDTSSENDLLWGVGTGCHGVVQVLLERIPVHISWVEALRANLAARLPTELAVVWESADASELGTLLADASLVPAGRKIFREVIAPPPALTIFGAGDDARPLARMAKALGWRVALADPRAAYATTARFEMADEIFVGPADQLVQQSRVAPGSLAVVMTHHYIHDRPILRDLMPLQLAYLGILGPKKRSERILNDLGVPLGGAQGQPARPVVHAPVGLDLGGDDPPRVALSILAEMQATLAGRDARPLRERLGPIHG